MKELKKHSSRLVGGVEMGNLGREDVQEGNSWRIGRYHICLWINQEEQLGSDTDHTPQSSSTGKIKPHNLWQ